MDPNNSRPVTHGALDLSQELPRPLAGLGGLGRAGIFLRGSFFLNRARESLLGLALNLVTLQLVVVRLTQVRFKLKLRLMQHYIQGLVEALVNLQLILLIEIERKVCSCFLVDVALDVR